MTTKSRKTKTRVLIHHAGSVPNSATSSPRCNTSTTVMARYHRPRFSMALLWHHFFHGFSPSWYELLDGEMCRSSLRSSSHDRCSAVRNATPVCSV